MTLIGEAGELALMDVWREDYPGGPCYEATGFCRIIRLGAIAH